MQVGFGKYILKIPIPIRLGGYIARTKKATGYHDNLYARAVLIKDSIQKIAMISLDFLGIDEYYFKYISNEVKSKIDRNITFTLSVTHSHSAPELYILKKDECDLSICKILIDGIIKSIELADKELSHANLFYGEEILADVSNSRQNKDKNIEVKLKTINVSKK